MELQEPQTSPNGKEKQPGPSGSPNATHVTGMRFVLMLGSLTLACFLIMLDASIVSTV